MSIYNSTPTQITPPRVAFIDSRNGAISREWYTFFLSLWTAQLDMQNAAENGPNTASALASYDAALRALEQSTAAQPSTGDLQSQIDALRQELNLTPRIELGTMAALQQANLPWITFDTTPQSVPDTTTGTLYWDTADRAKTLSLVMEDAGGVVQQIGQETFYRVKASSAILDGQVVMFTGTVGASGGLLAAPATGLTATQNEYIMGVATQNIARNSWGYVTWFGEVRGVNTTGGAEAWVDGQILYYNPAVPGGLTKTVPTAPNPKVIVAAVVHAATNGILFVRPTFGSALGATDSNVQITGLTNGDLLQYNGVQSRWENIPAASIIAGVGGIPVIKTADFTVAANEAWIINNKSGSSCVATLPAAATYPGRVLTFQNYQAQTLVSNASNVVPIGGGAAAAAILTAVVGDWATMVSNGTNWVIMQAAANNSLLLEG